MKYIPILLCCKNQHCIHRLRRYMTDSGSKFNSIETEQWNNIERYCYIKNRLMFSSPLAPLPCNRGKDSTSECCKPKSYYGNVQFSRAELGIRTDDPHQAVCRNSFVAPRTRWLPTWHRQPLATQCNAFSFVKLYGWIKLQATLLCTVQNPLLS